MWSMSGVIASHFQIVITIFTVFFFVKALKIDDARQDNMQVIPIGMMALTFAVYWKLKSFLQF